MQKTDRGRGWREEKNEKRRKGKEKKKEREKREKRINSSREYVLLILKEINVWWQGESEWG